MATRFRLTSDTTAPAVSPAIQTYSHTQTTRRQLLVTELSPLTNTAYNPDAADHLVAGDAHHIQFVSEQMSPGLVFTSGNTLKFVIQGSETNAGNNLQVQLFVSVVDAAGTTVQATLRSKILEGLELATTLTSRFLTTTLSGSYTTVAGDRLVVEWSVSGTPTAAGGVQGHNATFRWGSNGASGDLLENDTETGTLRNPWIEFATNITFAAPQTVTGTLFTQAPTFFVGTVTPGVVDLAGVLSVQTPTFFMGAVEQAGIPYTNLVVVETDDVPAPDSDLDHYLRAHARTAAGTGFIRIRLFQDTTLIAGFEFEPTATFTTYTYPLLEAEAAAITDYSDLQIHIDVKATGTPYTPEVDWVDLLRPPAAGITLTGTLFTKAPTFNVGAVTATYDLAGSLFVNTPTFPTGTVTPGTVTLTGTLYLNTPTFPTGAVSAGESILTGALFVNAPTFFTGTLTSTVALTGVLFQRTPTFPVGALFADQAIVGVLFVKAPTFPSGLVGVQGDLTGVLYVNTPVFFTGAMGQQGGSFWRPNPVGYTSNPVAYTLNPVAFTPVGPGDVPPWAIEVDGELFQKAPSFLVGAVS